jgi:glutamate/aspartate transport system substrate-binding protein
MKPSLALLHPLFVLLLLSLHASLAMAEAAGALQSIQRSGAIRLGYLDAAPPFSFEKDGQPAGYSVDLCKHVAEDIGRQLALPALRIEWVKLTQQTRLEAVRAGRVHIECGTTTWTLSRAEQVDFSLMTFVDGATVLVRGDSEIGRLADLSGRRIGVMQGTTTDASLREALKQRQIHADVVPISSPQAGIAKLSAGEIDGYASDRLVLLGLGLMTQGADFKLLDEDYSMEPYALALPRGDYELRLAVNRSLARLYRSRGIEEVFNRWLGALGKPSVLLTALYILHSIPE